MASLVTRRLFLAWFSGAVAALVAVPAEARPRPKPPPDPTAYGETFGGNF